MKRLDSKDVKAIVTMIAKGSSVGETAKKFGISSVSVGSIVRGVTHTNITGLTKKESGAKYIRKNADKFVSTDKASRKEKVVKVVSAPVVAEEAPVVSTTRPARKVKAKPTKKSKGKVKSTPTISIEKRVGNIVSESASIVKAMDSEISRIESELKSLDSKATMLRESQTQLKSQREHWQSVVNSLAPATLPA